MYYRNLVEDEKEARDERFWTGIAIGAIFFGLFYLWIRKKKE
jgi:hypothetical protein